MQFIYLVTKLPGPEESSDTYGLQAKLPQSAAILSNHSKVEASKLPCLAQERNKRIDRHVLYTSL